MSAEATGTLRSGAQERPCSGGFETKQSLWPWTPAASGFTCPLCLCEKSGSTWSNPQGSGDQQQHKIPAWISQAPSRQVYTSHQNFAEIPDELNLQAHGLQSRFYHPGQRGRPHRSHLRVGFFPDLSCNRDENETCTFDYAFQLLLPIPLGSHHRVHYLLLVH